MLQNGRCAYDLQPCLLLVPQILPEYSALILPEQRVRFATLDHIQPKWLGGKNNLNNFVMASTVQNGRKGGAPPEGEWVPKLYFTEAEITRAIREVERRRFEEASWLATTTPRWPPSEIVKLIIKIELSHQRCDFKFYPTDWRMVA